MKDQDTKTNEKKKVKEDAIDLIDLFKTLWNQRKVIIISVIIFTFLGLFVALFSEKEYKASTIMVPQIKNANSQLGGLSSLASLAGFNMDMNSGVNDISPLLYPMIISSVNFELELMNTKFLFEEMESPISLLDYYMNVHKPGLFGLLKKYTIELPGLIKHSLQKKQPDRATDSNSDIIRLTLGQYEVGNIIKKKLSLVVNDKDGTLTLVSRFHQASLSAQVAQKAQQLLQDYVTRFKVEKATAKLEFIRGRYEVSKSEFEEAQSKLATFRDANKNISSEIMRSQEERLQNEYQLTFDVYSELAKQLEQSLIEVEEDTPVFSVIDEVVVPFEKSKPKRMNILIISIFLGVFFGFGIVFGLSLISSARKRWKISGSTNSQHVH